LREGFQHYQRDPVRLTQVAVACLSRRHRHLLQRGQGKSALALSRDLCVSYKYAFALLHKLREAMAAELKGRIIGGEGKVAGPPSGFPKSCRLDRREAE
jgi:hypothetical protein